MPLARELCDECYSGSVGVRKRPTAAHARVGESDLSRWFEELQARFSISRPAMKELGPPGRDLKGVGSSVSAPQRADTGSIPRV